MLFSRLIELLRSHCLPFAVQKSYEQMEGSVFYLVQPVSHPAQSDNWVRGFACLKLEAD